jgi:hypothetical protein
MFLNSKSRVRAVIAIAIAIQAPVWLLVVRQIHWNTFTYDMSLVPVLMLGVAALLALRQDASSRSLIDLNRISCQVRSIFSEYLHFFRGKLR